MTALVVYLQNTVARLRDREGQTMAEYALIIGGIAIVVIAGILILGPAIRDLFDETGDSGQQLPELLSSRLDRRFGATA
jgi:pilus assembly protein Flp/PilA